MNTGFRLDSQRGVLSVLLLVLFSFSALALPLEHTCGSEDAAGPEPHIHSAGLNSVESSIVKPHTTGSGSDAQGSLCPACVWSHSLDRPASTTQPISRGLVDSRLSAFECQEARFIDLHRATSKRAPPNYL